MRPDEELLARVTRLEERVEELERFVGISEQPDELTAMTERFRAACKVKARAGIKPPGRI